MLTRLQRLWMIAEYTRIAWLRVFDSGNMVEAAKLEECWEIAKRNYQNCKLWEE